MHVVVIGAGVFGVWTAHHLLAAGARVTLVESHAPANSRSSSGDESRILRCGYGPDAIYSRMARASRRQWHGLHQRHEREAPIWHECGALWLCGADDPYMTATLATLQAESIPVLLLEGSALRERYPHLATADVGCALLEPSAGVLSARRAVRAVAREVTERGASIVRGRVVPPTSGSARRIVLSDGTVLAADAFVFACGAWLPSLFPDLLRDRIRPTRQAVVYFGVPAGTVRFGPSHTPAWVDFPAGIYGIPDLDGRGLKVGIDAHGPAFDPETGERVIDAGSVRQARTWLERRIPEMARAPVLESRVCQYENTSTGDFLIDRHPGHDQFWIAGGGSGHGFKHGPAVGEHVARRILHGDPAEPRFTLESKGATPARLVY